MTLVIDLPAWRDIRNAYLPFMHGEGLTNDFSDPVFRSIAVERDRSALVRRI